MANYKVEYRIQFTDVNGDSAQTSVQGEYADTATLAGLQGTASTLAADLGACSNAKITSIGVYALFSKAQISAGTAPPPANATYPSVTDGAELTFNNSGGGSRKVVVPAALLSDFVGGTNTVDPGDANIATLIAEIEAIGLTGTTTNLYQGGVKVGRHARRRPARKHL